MSEVLLGLVYVPDFLLFGMSFPFLRKSGLLWLMASVRRNGVRQRLLVMELSVKSEAVRVLCSGRVMRCDARRGRGVEVARFISMIRQRDGDRKSR